MRILFGYEYADEEVNALMRRVIAVIIGLTIFSFAWCRTRRALKTREQDNGGSLAKIIVVALALVGLGIGVIVGGNIYASWWEKDQIRLHKERDEQKERELERNRSSANQVPKFDGSPCGYARLERRQASSNALNGPAVASR